MKHVLDYIPEGQMSIFDYMENDKAKPNFKIGQRVYRVILDVVETGEITDIWDVSDKYFGYRTNEDCITFWERDLNDTIFTDVAEAYIRANKQKEKFTVIRKEDMQVIRERNFIEVCKDNRILISATVKFLKGNMVYYKNWFTYPFLEKFDDEKQAINKYNEVLEEVLKTVDNIKRFEVNAPNELKDMYLCRDGRWSEYRYVAHNGPKLKEYMYG